MIDVFVPCVPPTRTAQQKGVRVVGRRPIFYTKPEVKEANNMLWALFYGHRPKKPFDGPLSVTIVWIMPLRKSDTGTNYHWQRLDLGNLVKGFEDVLTKLGYWHDDGQIAHQEIMKMRGSPTGIRLKVKPLVSSPR